MAPNEEHNLQLDASVADVAGGPVKRPREDHEAACETPAKQTRGPQGKAKAQPRSSVKARAALPEPEEPQKPPSAFDFLAKQKWEHLVGGDKDRMEQAKLMWKALPPNERSELQLRAKSLADKYGHDMQEYAEALVKYKKSLPPAERAVLKQKEKEEAKQQKAESKQQAQELKEKSKEYRSALRDVGDRLKGSLQICKRGGMWEVPDGAVSYSGISLGLFRYMFGGIRSKMEPKDFDAQSASVVGRITGSEAGGIFGVTKIRGGSMYATYTIQRMTISYQPKAQKLTLAYEMDGF